MSQFVTRSGNMLVDRHEDEQDTLESTDCTHCHGTDEVHKCCCCNDEITEQDCKDYYGHCNECWNINLEIDDARCPVCKDTGIIKLKRHEVMDMVKQDREIHKILTKKDATICYLIKIAHRYKKYGIACGCKIKGSIDLVKEYTK